MTDKLYHEYGNAGHKFPRTTQEAYGPGACVFVHNEIYDEEDDITGFSWYYGIVIYTLAAIVVGVILLA